MYQSLTVVGRLGRDPELKFLASGDPVCSFSLAIDRTYAVGDGQKRTETIWMRVSVFGRQAEIVNQHVRKGELVLVQGRLVGDPGTGGPLVYVGRDGKHKAAFEVTADGVRFLSPRSQAGSGPAADEHGASDDLPF
jgi:single-strand DNA-binding protein